MDYCGSVQFKRTNHCSSLFPNISIIELTRTNSIHRTLFFPFYISLFTWAFLSLLKAPYLTVAMLSPYLSPVNCRSRKINGNFRNKLNYSWCRWSSGMLRSVIWMLVTSVSRQSVGKIFKFPAVEGTPVTKNICWESFQKRDLIHKEGESLY